MRKSHTVHRGDSFSLLIPLRVNGVMPYPVEGWEFWFTVKNSPSDADEDALFQLSTTGGGILPHGSSTVRIEGLPEHTKTQALGKYVYDIQAKSPSGRLETLEVGDFVIDYEVTITA